MNPLTRSIFIALLIVVSSTSLFAKAKIPLGEREVLNKVLDLPDTDEFKLKDGSFFDLATLHKEFNIAYLLPLYIIEEPKLVGFNEQTDTFYDIPQNEIDAILAAQKLNKEELNKLPFYTKYGGKIVALLIIGLLIWGAIPSKKEKVKPQSI
jgi:hypothetical protein